MPLFTDTIITFSQLSNVGMRSNRRKMYLRVRGGTVVATVQDLRLDTLSLWARSVNYSAFGLPPIAWLQTSAIMQLCLRVQRHPLDVRDMNGRLDLDGLKFCGC